MITRNSISPDQKIILVNIANELADAARGAILPFFRTDRMGTKSKEIVCFDPVTEADMAAEHAIRMALAKKRPYDGISGEEYDDIPSKSGLTWIIDPIDGTRAFVSGAPTWGVLIALADSTGPFLGLIDQPYISERFIGGFGQAFYTGPQGEKTLKTRNITDLSETTLFTTFPEVGRDQDSKGFGAVKNLVKLVRYGMDCYAYALLAAGHIDLVIEAGLKAYDISAPIAVVEAAGGIVTNWRGGDAHNGGQVVAASNQKLLEQVLVFLLPFAD